MRIQNSFAAAVAAAVAAVVFSAAFQPAEASIIVIDDFTQVQTDTGSGSGGSVGINNDLILGTPSFGGFDQRSFFGNYPQASTRGFRTVSASSSAGQGTLFLSNSGAGTGVTGTSSAQAADVNMQYYNTVAPFSVDLTGQQYAGFWIETLNTSATPAGSFKGYLYVKDSDGGNFTYTFPSMWPSNQAIGLPFTSFPGVNFSKVEELYVGIKNTTNLPGNTAYNATANFKAISVPEPTQMVSVAAVGAMYGAWRLRKLRRSRTAAGDATAG